MSLQFSVQSPNCNSPWKHALQKIVSVHLVWQARNCEIREHSLPQARNFEQYLPNVFGHPLDLQSGALVDFDSARLEGVDTKVLQNLQQVLVSILV